MQWICKRTTVIAVASFEKSQSKNFLKKKRKQKKKKKKKKKKKHDEIARCPWIHLSYLGVSLGIETGK